ncbi:alpha/beta hydrolase family protein [Acidovorax lacteus]|uniref:Dienelactone hydrolase n=1 Tax=Acidovorax lacteus TaxID=1924988 RepID=A0ABP8L9C0_9BURK
MPLRAWSRWLAVALAALAASLGAVSPAAAQHAGLRRLAVPTATESIEVLLFYPTATAARAIPMGPWLPVVAPGAPASAAPLRGLLLLSHGTGGDALGHHSLATRLAAAGYLVAALRHPGDHWQDRSLMTSGRYFSERPRQVSQVLDALLAHPEWGARIPAQRVGAVGHSAGGYTVLALAGAQAEPDRARRHCASAHDDPGFCALARTAMGGTPQGQDRVAQPQDGDRVSAADPRIRAVVALAPMAVVLTPESLAAVRVPVRILMAEHDAVLTARYHGGHVAAHVPGSQASTVPGAGHFAFMAVPQHSLPSDSGDVAADPPGFDRGAYQDTLAREVLVFWARVWP